MKNIKNLLETMGSDIVYCGENGSGSKMKIINNYMSIALNILTAETLNLADKSGIDKKMAIELMLTTAAGKGHMNLTYPAKVFKDDPYYEIWGIDYQTIDDAKKAIDNGEFTVFYQPIMDVNSNTLSSVEALLRWKLDDEHISPAVFIPLAERGGLMPEIGAWVLNRALIDLSHWQFKQGLAISINVSVSQLLDDSFLKTLDNALKSTQISSERLHLEITESVFASNKEVVSVKVNELVARGIKVSIDDFGTGYSSLSRLQSMPCDFIKIDRSFVQNSSEESDTIIRATLLMAKEFGCKTIAEGIETEQQRQHLSQLGTDYLQGFYFARPMNANDLISWYNENY